MAKLTELGELRRRQREEQAAVSAARPPRPMTPLAEQFLRRYRLGPYAVHPATSSENSEKKASK